jgi:cytochrome c oxidase subunit III
MEEVIRKPRPISNAEFGMWIGLASFGMLFATLFLSYGLARLRAPIWPPIGVDSLPKLLPTLATLALIASSWTLHKALEAYNQGLKKLFLSFWNWTLFLGFVFLAVQAFSWKQVSAFGEQFNSNLYGNIFYAMTGLHALHILGGILVLLIVSIKISKKNFFSREHGKKLSQAPKLSAMYWHFMDFIWVLMYLLLVWI